MKVVSIFKYNGFGNEKEFMVYELISRFNHSCIPNCFNEQIGKQYRCRTILPIKAGEELTIEYNSLHRIKPTHIRRKEYLEFKDFTCHCARCENPADDTRQFSCFDVNCTGRHYTCQPINNEQLPVPELAYTGVEYII